MQQVVYRQALFLLAADIQNDLAGIHHNQPVAVGDGVLHIVGDHQRGQLSLLNKAVGKLQHLGSGFGVQGGGVLIQQQHLRLFHDGHQQGKRLPLPAGKQPDLGGKPILQPQIQLREKPAEGLTVGGGDGPLESPAFAAAGGQRHIFFDPHIGGGAHHRVLKNTAEKPCPLFLRKMGNILPVDGNAALIHREGPGDGIQQGGFARPVAADDGDEIAVIQGEGKPVQRNFLVDGPGVKDLADIFQLQHTAEPPLA